jgi:hypothetical protein
MEVCVKLSGALSFFDLNQPFFTATRATDLAHTPCHPTFIGKLFGGRAHHQHRPSPDIRNVQNYWPGGRILKR